MPMLSPRFTPKSAFYTGWVRILYPVRSPQTIVRSPPPVCTLYWLCISALNTCSVSMQDDVLANTTWISLAFSLPKQWNWGHDSEPKQPCRSWTLTLGLCYTICAQKAKLHISSFDSMSRKQRWFLSKRRYTTGCQIIKSYTFLEDVSARFF